MELPKKDNTVKFEGLHEAILAAMQPIFTYYQKKGLKALVTSGKDGTHSKNSAHYKGQALDLRSMGVKNPGPFCAGLQGALAMAGIPNGYFYVVWENDHIHVEWASRGEAPNIVGYKPGKYYYCKEMTPPKAA